VTYILLGGFEINPNISSRHVCYMILFEKRNVNDDVILQFYFHLFFASWVQNHWGLCRVSVQGVKSLGGHFACFYEVKKKLSLFFEKKMEIILHF
jgi:hypothetical protein